jgi:pimeloyl-ACP methyl ester carboxylesterase
MDQLSFRLEHPMDAARLLGCESASEKAGKRDRELPVTVLISREFVQSPLSSVLEKRLWGPCLAKSISDGGIERYARAYSGPGQMAAAMGMYRAIDDDEKFARERRGPLNVPLTLVGGGNSFGRLLAAMAKGLEDAGAKSVATETVAGSGHYLLDEKPAETTALIERYASIASSERDE